MAMRPLAVVVVAAVVAVPAAAQFQVVIPAGLAATEGSSTNLFPWGRGGAGLLHQCVYDSSHFTSQGITGPIVITGLKWRPNGNVALAASSYPAGCTVKLSTSPFDHAAVSTTFANNRGADLTTCYSGVVAWGAQAAQPGPAPFGISVPFQTSFLYDPAIGDLNIECDLPVQAFSGTGSSLDVHAVAGQALASRVYVSNGYPGAGIGIVNGNHAVVVEVTYVPAAANDESRGPLAGAATAVLVDGGLPGSTDAETRVHRNGFTLAPTVALPPSSTQVDLRTVLQQWNAPPGLDIDDISLGRDEVLADASGELLVPSNAWGLISFSLKQGATGAPGTRIAREAALGNVGSALFSWVLPGSNYPPQLLGRTERSHSASELGLPPGAEVDAVDFPVVFGRDQGTLTTIEPGFLTLIGGTAQTIYFTVSSATANLVPAFWWGSSTANLASGANILRVARTASSGAWGPPTVFRYWFQLGLQQADDIDGLAVDIANNKLLFSCVGTARDQFLFVDMSADGSAAVPLKKQDGTPVSQSIGKGQNDDVDAICTLDPIGPSQSTVPPPGVPPGGDDFGSSCGAPSAGLLGVPSINATAFRRHVGGQTWFDSWMMGWPPLTGVTPGVAVLYMTVGNDLTLFPVGPIQLRNTNPAVPGDPLLFSFQVPPSYWLTSQTVTFRWAAIDAGFTAIAEAWPVRVAL
jgi:hypothetical protein